jgi:hypothetical protein
MKLLISVFCVLAWIGGCSENSDEVDSVTFEAEGKWLNTLAADGCSWHFAITSKDTTLNFVPNESSISKIEAAVGKMEGAYSINDVYLKYALTDRKREIQCGWGHTATYDEINVIDIKRR